MATRSRGVVVLLLHACLHTMSWGSDLGSIVVEPVEFKAGDAVELSWTCTDMDSVYVTLCRGGSCSFTGASPPVYDPYYIMSIQSSLPCAASRITWRSEDELESGDDYWICLEGRSGPEGLLRNCKAVSINALAVKATPSEITAGESIRLHWTCGGPESVRTTLCKGGACSHGSKSLFHVRDFDSSAPCAAGWTWNSTKGLKGDDYYVCVEDVDAPSVRDCALVNIRARRGGNSIVLVVLVGLVVCIGSCICGTLGFFGFLFAADSYEALKKWYTTHPPAPAATAPAAKPQTRAVERPAPAATAPAAKPKTKGDEEGLPSYWSGLKPPSQGWRLEVPDESTRKALQQMLQVADPKQLGVGRDARPYTHTRAYNHLEFYTAWRVEHPLLWQGYTLECAKLRKKAAQLSRQGCERDQITPLLQGAEGMPGGCVQDVNEAFLISGTKPENLLAILDQGLDAKLSKQGMLGVGIYFAETVMKTDQYATADSSKDQEGLEELHARLFRARCVQHPGEDLFYCLVARVALGWSVATGDAETRITSGESVFHNAQKLKLAVVPGSRPAVPYQSLVLETGGAVRRHREFVIQTNAQCYLEYVVAYKRVWRADLG